MNGRQARKLRQTMQREFTKAGLTPEAIARRRPRWMSRWIWTKLVTLVLGQANDDTEALTRLRGNDGGKKPSPTLD